MQKTKILHILYSGQGGLGTYFMNFVNSDQKQHFEHFAFFYGIEPLNEELEDFCKKNAVAYEYQQRQSKIDLKAVREVMAFQKKHEIQYLLLHTFSLSLLTLIGLFKNWKLIAIDHTPSQVKTKIEQLFTLINHLCAYKMIYFYKGHFESNQRIFPFLKIRENSHIVPKTVDINFFQPLSEKTTRSTFTLGITARLIQGKRHDLVIKALANLRDEGIQIHLKIAGSGPKEKELKASVSQMNLDKQVEFSGLLNREQLLSFYHSLDAYIHASEGETICYSIMEAQACALPVLASDVEGVNNAISREEGGLLFTNSAVAIAQKILTITKDAELRKACGLASRHVAVEKYKKFNNSEMLHTIVSQ